VLTGTGEVPVRRQIEALVKIGYRGFYSFEWRNAGTPILPSPRLRSPSSPPWRPSISTPREYGRCRRASRSSCCCLLRFRRPPSGARWNLIAGGASHLGDVSGAQAVAFDDSGWRRLDVRTIGASRVRSAIRTRGKPTAERCPARGVVSQGLCRLAERYRQAGVRRVRRRVSNSQVWINGQYLGKRPYGYSSFRYEVTPHSATAADGT